MPWEKHWVPPVPGLPPGGDPALVGGRWVETFRPSAEELEQGQRAAAAESKRVADQSGWIASEATAEEVLSTVWRGSRARYFPGEVLRDAWVRLAAAGGLPDATNELVRLGHQRLPQLGVATEDREQSELLWPTRIERKHFVPAFVGSSGTLYEIVSQNPSGAGLDRHTGVSLVAARRGEPLWVQPETPWYRANLPAWLQGDIVIPVEDPDSMQTSVAMTKELIPAEYTTAICTALKGTLRAAGRHP